MKLLAFDTCLDKMYVVLTVDNSVLSSRIVETTESTYHSAYLISSIAEILRENNITPKELDAIAVNIGPGSFTGIRACVTVARVMAQQLGVKTVGVSSLEVISRLAPVGKTPFVAMDARKNMAYVYCKKMFSEAISLENVKNMVKSDDYYVITDNKLIDELGGVSYQKNDADLGLILAEIAHEKLSSNPCGDFSWRNLRPLYIQPAPVFGK